MTKKGNINKHFFFFNIWFILAGQEMIIVLSCLALNNENSMPSLSLEWQELILQFDSGFSIILGCHNIFKKHNNQKRDQG